MKKAMLFAFGIVIIAGGFYLQASEAADPFRAISVPPAPEASTTPMFVPASGEVSQPVEDNLHRSESHTNAEICVGSDSQNFECYEKQLVQLVKEEGIAAAFSELKAWYPKNSYVVTQCHPLTHVIGREAALKFSDVSDAYRDGDAYCWSGYYHGVLETFLNKIGTENLAAKIDTVCAGIEGKARYSFDYYNCVHGLGHGVMAVTETELFESLAYCDNLTGDWEQKSCASGAFMENVIVDNLNHFTKYLKPEEPLYPCTASPEKYKETCYLMQTSYILKINSGDFNDTFSWCRKAEEPYRHICFQSLGRDASGRTSSDVARSSQLCLSGKDYFERSNCVIGAVKDFVSYFHSDVEAEKFCAALEDSDLMAICRSTKVSYYAQF